MTINPFIQRYRTLIIIAVVWLVLLLAKGLEVRPQVVTARPAPQLMAEGTTVPITSSVSITGASPVISITQVATPTMAETTTETTVVTTTTAPTGTNPVTNSAAAVAPLTGAAANGQTLYSGTCAACHGPAGEGVKGLGKDMTTSQFIAGLTDDELLAFIKRGRDTSDPLNTTGVMMPPKGGNPALSDAKIMDIIAYIRSIQKP